MWKKKLWILHQDNALANNTLTMKEFSADMCIPVLKHPLYSLDLAPCNFYLFPPREKCIQRNSFSACRDKIKNGRPPEQGIS
jgi:hypothetical protein